MAEGEGFEPPNELPRCRFSSRTHHLNTRPTINRRNLSIISNIPDFISLFFTINSSILPKCFRNFFCCLGLISKHKIYLFLPLQVAYVFFYKQFFYSFVSGYRIKFDYPMCTGSFDVCHLFTILRLPKKGLTIPEVASISGHITPQMLFRYAHADQSKIAEKLAG